MIPRGGGRWSERGPQREADRLREASYRGLQIAGLLLLGGGILATALVRARWHDLFPTGWWHVW